MVKPRQFDVFANPSPKHAHSRPFVIALQHDFLSEHATQLVAPLVAPSALRPTPRLNPTFEIGGQTVALSPTEIAVLPSELLKQKIASLAARRVEIIAALDLVFTGI